MGECAQFGRFHAEHHFHLEAKEKYQQASALSSGQPAEIYWDYGIAWAEIAQHSGEAVELRHAIDAFQTSLKMQEKLAQDRAQGDP